MQKLERKSLEARATATLEEAIISGDLSPGTRLTEIALAAQLGASRGTTRAALANLANAGLIVQRPYASWEVVAFEPKDIWEVFTLRSALETLAIDLGVCLGTQPGRDRVEQAYGALEAACRGTQLPAIAAADLLFHKALVMAADHALLFNHFERVEARVRILITSSNARLPSPREILAQHEPIFSAFMARDRQGSVDALRGHILSEGETLVQAHHAQRVA